MKNLHYGLDFLSGILGMADRGQHGEASIQHRKGW